MIELLLAWRAARIVSAIEVAKIATPRIHVTRVSTLAAWRPDMTPPPAPPPPPMPSPPPSERCSRTTPASITARIRWTVRMTFSTAFGLSFADAPI